MASLSPHRHPLLLLPTQTRSRNPHLTFFPTAPSRPLRRASLIARLTPLPDLPDLEVVRDLLGRVEGVVYTLADAAAAQDPKQSGDWLSGITGYMEAVLKVLKDGLTTLHVPYAYGFAIIMLTVLVKAATFPLSKKQVESALAMRSLQPQVKAIQQRYAGDAERIQLETARLYKLAGVNPLAGCLPTLATIPVWIGLYRALSNVANEGLLTEGFFWIPSLAGPTTVAARQSGSGISWIFPFVDGHPPLGWHDTLAYLVLPVLLVVSQYISAQIMQPSQGTDPNQQSTQVVTKILPLMIGYFALSVPSGLSLYWLTNNILSTAQQIWFQKLGGAKSLVKQHSDGISKDEPLNISASKVERPVLGTEAEEVKSKDEPLNISASKVERPVLGTEAEEVKSTQKVDSGGLRPGERFKQLKEQEARIRKQREEEKRKAEETLASSCIVEQQYTEVRSIENKDEQDSGDRRREQPTYASTNGGFNYHGNSAVKDEKSAHEKVPEDDAGEVHDSSGKKASADIIFDKRDQETERGEA